ncbi:MAG: DUF362 domain-containing protein [Planctomycetes bacterium]|nr:DUF362 domain-containing protein [Planctomycetota bacterium]
MRNPVVSIIRCPRHDDEAVIREAMAECLARIDGLESIICPGDTVLLKPNLISEKSYETGVVTNPHVVKVVAELVKEAGAGKVFVGDGAAVGHTATGALEAAGYHDVLGPIGVELIDLHKGEFVLVPIPNGVVFRKLRIARPVLEAQVVINLPVPKTHDVFPLTLGLKNMKGVIHPRDKRRFHKWGLAQGIVDLQKVVLPELTIFDGTVAHEGTGPTRGAPMGLGLLVASTDTVAADVVMAHIAGVPPEEIPYIGLAAEQGLGCGDLSAITVLGETIEDVRRPFQRIRLDEAVLRRHDVAVVEAGACSGCRQVVTEWLMDLEQKGELDRLRGRTIVYGQNVHAVPDKRGDFIVIGSCVKKFKDKGRTLPGCPPEREALNEI